MKLSLRKVTVRSSFAALFVLAAGSLMGQQKYQFTTYSIPGAASVNSGSINDAGDIAGSFAVSRGDGSYLYVGYLRSSTGEITIIHPPEANENVFVGGINNEGEIVGQYTVLTGSTYETKGFVYFKGTYATVVPNGQYTLLSGLNNKRAYVGLYGDGSPEGFVSTPNGTSHLLNVPNGSETTPLGINDMGLIVGYDLEPLDLTAHGFLFDGATFSTLDYPGAAQTFPLAINDAGVIVGYFYFSGHSGRGFIYQDGTFGELSIPGATDTVLSGINNRRVLTGQYTTGNNQQVVFVAGPAAN